MKIQVPIIKNVDALLIGGTAEGCQRAIELRKLNKTVFCVTPYTYFGEEYAAKLDYENKKLSILSKFDLTVWNHNPAGIKQIISSAMISAGVDFLYQNNPVAPLYDNDNNIRGVLFAGRSGFFAVASKVIIDVTQNSIFNTNMLQTGLHEVSINVIGGANTDNVDSVEAIHNFNYKNKTLPVFRAKKKFNIKTGSISELSQIDLKMRTLVWSPETLKIADECTFDFANSTLPEATTKSPVFTANALVESIAKMIEGNKSGTTWSFNETIKTRDKFDAISFDTLFRWKDCPTVSFNLNSLPIDDAYDVLVCGGGTGGAPAAISAARAGAKTICAEKLSIPGGVCTAGRIATYWFGNCCGFTEEMDIGVGAMAPVEDYFPLKGNSPKERKSAYLTQELFNSGCEVRFNTLCVGALVQKNKTCGAILAGPWGVTLVPAKVSVDASGNADLVAASRGPVHPLIEEEPAIQGAGLPPYELDRPALNSDYLFCYDSDVVDATTAFVMAQDKFANKFDVAQILDTRERRRIIGDIELQPQDFFAQCRYNDTIVIARSNFDTHGFVIHPMFLLKHTEHQPYSVNVPYRALLPKDWNGVIVTGLGVSAHRDCMPLIRMQPDVQNQGYSAGLAAATAAKEGKEIRDINIRELQRRLIDVKILPERVLAENDSRGEFAENDSHKELSDIFLEPQESEKVLVDKFKKSPDLFTAQLLAFLGNPIGKDLLEQTIKNTPWDTGWNYRGMGQFGQCASKLDVTIMAYRNTNGPSEVVLDKLQQLTPISEFSHFRAVMLYLIKKPDLRAVVDLEKLLTTDNFSGHALETLDDALRAVRGNIVDTTVRNSQLKELYVAKALQACKPESKLAAKIIDSYRQGRQALFSFFADSGK